MNATIFTLLFFKTSDQSPKQFGEENPVLNYSFTKLLLWDFVEDLGFHFLIYIFILYLQTKTTQSGLNVPRPNAFYLFCT